MIKPEAELHASPGALEAEAAEAEREAAAEANLSSQQEVASSPITSQLTPPSLALTPDNNHLHSPEEMDVSLSVAAQPLNGSPSQLSLAENTHSNDMPLQHSTENN